MHINIKSPIHDHSDDLIKLGQIEIKNILVHEKNVKDLVIYFARYVNCKLIKMWSLYFQKLIGKIEEHKGKGKKAFDGWWLYDRLSIRQD